MFSCIPRVERVTPYFTNLYPSLQIAIYTLVYRLLSHKKGVLEKNILEYAFGKWFGIYLSIIYNLEFSLIQFFNLNKMTHFRLSYLLLYLLSLILILIGLVYITYSHFSISSKKIQNLLSFFLVYNRCFLRSLHNVFSWIKTRWVREKQIIQIDKTTGSGDWQIDYQIASNLLQNLEENINIELWYTKSYSHKNNE